jgi:hypothetical protein
VTVWHDSINWINDTLWINDTIHIVRWHDSTKYHHVYDTISQAYPRVIKSEIVGIIDAQSMPRISSPYISLDATGIMIKRYPVEIRTNHVIVQNLRGRAGTEMPGITLGDRDAFRIDGSAYKVVIDHCSIGHGCDENLSMMEGAHDITISNCIIAEALMWTSGYSYGTLINDNCKNISFIKNAFIMNSNRNPLISIGGTVEWINNLTYTPRFNGVDFDNADVTIKGSVKIGASNSYIARAREGASAQSIYMEDNISASGFENASGICRILSAPIIDSKNYVKLPASQVENYVVQNAGAFPRDQTDARIINELVTRTGTIKSSVPLTGAVYDTVFIVGADVLGRFTTDNGYVRMDWSSNLGYQSDLPFHAVIKWDKCFAAYNTDCIFGKDCACAVIDSPEFLYKKIE